MLISDPQSQEAAVGLARDTVQNRRFHMGIWNVSSVAVILHKNTKGTQAVPAPVEGEDIV